ncbi:MAG: STAS domain-containing protein [Candidatus Aminicenantes bacterium]|nr:STAS domain-containing protein [Candidatus Aminicenantes bacterium]NLH77341.1 STAS domain-containing protein [Acidobacteriota bacterium]
MMMTPLTIKTREVDGVVVLDVDGEIRRSDTPQISLYGLVQSQLERGRRQVVLNLAGVGFIDSFGVGEILASYKSIQDLGGSFKLCRISEKLRIIFEITRLVTVLDIHESCEAALDSFGKG